MCLVLLSQLSYSPGYLAISKIDSDSDIEFFIRICIGIDINTNINFDIDINTDTDYKCNTDPGIKCNVIITSDIIIAFTDTCVIIIFKI